MKARPSLLALAIAGAASFVPALATAGGPAVVLGWQAFPKDVDGIATRRLVVQSLSGLPDGIDTVSLFVSWNDAELDERIPNPVLSAIPGAVAADFDFFVDLDATAPAGTTRYKITIFNNNPASNLFAGDGLADFFFIEPSSEFTITLTGDAAGSVFSGALELSGATTFNSTTVGPNPTPSPSPTASPTATEAPTATPTVSPTASPTAATPTPTDATPSPTDATPSPTDAATATPTASATPSPTDSATPSPTAATPTPTDATPSPTSATPSPTSATPSPTAATPTPTPTATASPTTATPSPTAEPTPSQTPVDPSSVLDTLLGRVNSPVGTDKNEDLVTDAADLVTGLQP